MSWNKLKAKEWIKQHGLRVTAPRLAVVMLLSTQRETPLSYTEVLEHLGDTDWDPATIYRNLVKLEEMGVTQIAHRANGIARYELALHTRHTHPHFVCNDCGIVSCLPKLALPSVHLQEQRWQESLQTADIQIQGNCPDCLDK